MGQIVPAVKHNLYLDTRDRSQYVSYPMRTITDVISLWPSLSAFAEDVGVAYGVAKQWRRRNSIPGERWAPIISAAERRGIPISLEILAEIAQRAA